MSKQNYKLHLKGYVGGWDFDADYVDYVLTKNSEAEVHVLIDSLGGSLAKALSIVAAFRNHGNVHVHYVGMNASAATIASLGARHVSIDSSAMYLVHKCSMEFFQWASANADKLQDIIHEAKQMKADLDKMDSNIAEMYAKKCKKEPSDLLALMKKGGWLTAQEALDWGFVDEITDYAEDEAPLMTDTIAADMHANGIPVPSMGEPPTANPFMKFVEAMTHFFRSSSAAKTEESNDNNNIQVTKTMEQTTTTQTAEPQAQQTPQTLQMQLDNANAALAEKDKKINELNDTITSMRAEIDALKKAPGDTTSHVVDTKPNAQEKHEPANEIERYIQTRSSAQALYDSVVH